uniref:Probable tRNA modification GTPase MnmE n=1 Tax=Cyanidioschyzon merolae (strain NIES-3377 / 10D) TaxID=280699 RepID=MNME_CYAM1|nr:tRNA modification GTPase [Cyanidioschyzon merolae strain 10D]Q85FG3.1 RecName: Full=Probable tRNA modification GTPase MnmE [Cyanidioschyzon merolae strain 10D]BAC76115.1 tRNA modification GTPase [Cyanidioschyzon merolae strain 10D]
MTLANVFIQDTIVAIATYLAPSSVAIIRLSGNEAIRLAKSICVKKNHWHSHRIIHTYVQDDQNQLIDEVLVLPMLAPRSYTRQDVVEIHAHGGVVVAQTILQLLINRGARLAKPGEFTLRAFINGRLTLTQAESVLELIHAPSVAMAKKALSNLRGALSTQLHQVRSELIQLLAQIEAHLDFDLDNTFVFNSFINSLTNIINQIQNLLNTPSKFYRYGIQVALLGPANAGKSTLFNALIGEERSIVTPIAGTTTDVVEATLQWQQICFRFFDTAGLKEASSEIETKAMAKAQQIAKQCDLILWIIDATSPNLPIPPYLLNSKPLLVVYNKIDVDSSDVLDHVLDHTSYPTVKVSALYATNLSQLKQLIWQQATQLFQLDGIYINERQSQLLQQAKQHLCNLQSALDEGYPLEIISWHLKNAIQCLDENDVNASTLNAIFSQFCIGK